MNKVIAMLAALGAAVVPAVPSGAMAEVSNAGYYSNQTPYGNAGSSEIAEPPAGYTVGFLETVGRHGARSLTDNGAEVRSLALWESANRQGKLTVFGRQFKADVRAFQAAEKRLGYGNLSTVGVVEWRGIGKRTAANYPGFFDAAESTGDDILFKTTTVKRTQASAAAMKATLDAAHPKLDTDSTKVDSHLLIESGSTTKGRAAIAKALSTSLIKAKARHLLERTYKADFVARIKDPVQAAVDVYLLYCTAPGMASNSDITFARYVPLVDAPSMAQAKDTQNFYRYGPGVTGERSSFDAADPILADFFARMDTRLAGGSVAAVFRLAHGETTMPFAARIKAPGSEKQSGAYTYGTNSWRGWVAGRLAGNIEWALYTAEGRSPLVTMRYNEQPVKFDSACQADDPSGYFYRLDELKRCLK